MSQAKKCRSWTKNGSNRFLKTKLKPHWTRWETLRSNSLFNAVLFELSKIGSLELATTPA